MYNLKNLFVVLSLAILCCVSTNVFAQNAAQGCANIEIQELIGEDTVVFSAAQRTDGITLTCDTASRILLPIGFAPGYPDPDNGYYTYEKISYDPPIAFNPANGNLGEKLALPVDDCWGALFNFDYYFPPNPDSDTPGFKFFFYDESFSTVMPNSNGGLHMFNSSSPMLAYAQQQGINLYTPPTAGSYLHCPYSTSQPLPDNRDMWGSEKNPTFNSINGPWFDIHYGNAQGNQGMYIKFSGEYPCRMCILTFYDIPSFGNYGSADTANISSMIVLYETTNVIEFYLKRKPAKTSTNGSNAILGIQNLDATESLAITNNQYAPNGGTPKTQSYNNTVWEATNEAWRIKPVGELPYYYTWYKKNSSGPQQGVMQTLTPNSNNQVIANPSEDEGDTWYYCKMNVTRQEDGLEFDVWDSILIHPLNVPSLTISHNSADNAGTVAMNTDSLSMYDTICAGDRVTFRFTGGDEYHFVEPTSLAAQQILNGTATVPQDPDVEKVFYKFHIINFKDGNKNDTLCQRYDSCWIVNRKVNVSIGEDTSVCEGKNVVYTEALNELVETNTYLWTFGGNPVSSSMTADFKPVATGTLTLKLTDNRNCSATDDAKITVVKYPVVDITGTKDICKGNSTKLTAEHDAGEVSYTWGTAETTKTIEVKPDQTTEYVVTVTTKLASCATTKTTTVNVYPIPEVQCYEDAKICEQETALVGVIGEAEGYVWSTNDASVNQGNLSEYTVSPEATTKYTVTAYSNPELHCESTASMTVYVEKKPVPVMTMTPDYIDELTPVVVFNDKTTGIVDRIWTISDGATSTDKNFRHTFEVEDSVLTYYVTLTGITGYGCVDSITTPISVVREHHIWAPTGIYIHSNIDDNRQFKVVVDNIYDFNLKIFNRWGTLVFETDDVTQAWDCTYKGEVVKSGVYTWYATYHHSDSPDRLMQKAGTFMIYN